MNDTLHLRLLEGASLRFMEDARSTDPTTEVPSCPGWRVNDLVLHIGGLYEWVAYLVEQGVNKETWRHHLPSHAPAQSAEFSEIMDWLDTSRTSVLRAIADVAPEMQVWSWGSDQHVRFWVRRMLAETTVHHCDLQISLDERPDLESEVADDLIEELLEVLPSTLRWGDSLDNLRGPASKLQLSSDSSHWRVKLTATGFFWDRSVDPKADTSISGSSSQLLLALYRRRSNHLGDPTILGNLALWERWLASTSF